MLDIAREGHLQKLCVHGSVFFSYTAPVHQICPAHSLSDQYRLPHPSHKISSIQTSVTQPQQTHSNTSALAGMSRALDSAISIHP